MEALAALRLWAYEVSFPRIVDADGIPHMFRIEPLPAADWLIATFDPGRLAYLPGLLSDAESERLIEALHVGEVTHDELVEANRDALEEMSGWPWWSASKLMAVLYQQFDMVGGLLVLSGMDLRTQPLGAVLAAVNAKVLEFQSKEERAKWLNELAMPPASKLDPDNWDEEAAERALEMLMARGGTGLTD
jgi:hypothetical protein